MQDANILLPSKLKIVTEDEQNGTYEIEGLYPGYGHTLGNSLRRIILSSLPGAAITAVKIAGADHEFATLPGVKEDVIAILLNLKKIRFQLDGVGPETAVIKVKGAKTITGADIETPGGLEVLNKDQFICESTEKSATVEVEITVERGLGFVSKDKHHKEKVSTGTILVDAVFTPIRKASYEVENMRVGDRTDHNRLRVSIQTDGTLSPRTALESSIKTMLTQLRAVLDLKEIAETTPVIDMSEIEEASTTEEPLDQSDILKTRIDSLDLSTRTMNALSDASIRTVGGLVKKTENELLALEGIGNKGVQEIIDMLSGFDLALKE